jgi:tetratricopeptide (TPR) repeat protein
VNARLNVKRWSRLARLPKEQQQQFTESLLREVEGHLQQVRGRYREAEQAHRKALGIRRKVLGEEHPTTARCYNSVAYCLSAQGKHRDAIRCWQAALLGVDVGRLDRASSGFERSLVQSRFLTPRAGLSVSHALLKEPRQAWQHAEADLARSLLDDLFSPPICLTAS